MHAAAGNSQSAICAKNLARRFGSVIALDDVSVDIARGEFFSLLGPSGCGKTTLLRLIAGLDQSDAGSLTILGRDANGWPAHERPVNTVFQSYALFPHLDVFENISFGLRMKKVAAADIRTRVGRAMDLVQISRLGQRKPHELSGGQKQRVALARAVVNEPRILLLDEPLGALDLKLRKQLQLELHHLQKRLGITFVYVTHDQDEALTMSDRIAVMDHGRIMQLGVPEELYERPRNRFVAQFLGSCNLIEGRWKNNVKEQAIVETSGGDLEIAGASSRNPVNDRVTLAIRPEKISLLKASFPRGQNTIAGVVCDIIYSGAETNYLVRAGEREVKSCLFNSPGHQHFVVGESVHIHLPPQALIVLED